MIIRHDLRLVFLHVPKCAGKQLRDIFLIGSNSENSESLFNFDYSPTLHRHVDLAHLPAADLVHWPQFKWLSLYTTIAVIRNPYERLTSAANEFFRQSSKHEESIVNSGKITQSMRLKYLKQIPLRHSQLDPRFVHSLPISWFTHLGMAPQVDHLLRCETLADDFQTLATKLKLPNEMRVGGKRLLSNCPSSATQFPLSTDEVTIANILYRQDFATFHYLQLPDPPDNGSASDVISQLTPGTTASHKIPLLNRALRVEWHWGPTSERQESIALPATR